MSDKPIFYLTRTYSGVTPETILKGVLQATKEYNRTIFAVHGGGINSEKSFIYNLIDPEDSAGLMTWASTTANPNDPLYEKFKNKPRVSLSTIMTGMKSIAADNITGMKEAMLHLIKVHNRRKILFIKGPDDNDYANQRLQAYQDVLRSEGIGVDERLMTDHGRWEVSRGMQSVCDFMDKRGLKPGEDFDALVAVNDNLAIGAIKEFQNRRVRVPETVSVIGFNNSDAAKCFSPSVTTVAMPFIAQGYEAVESLINMEQGGIEHGVIKLPTTLSLAQSCGCLSSQVENALSGNKLRSDPFKKKNLFSRGNSGPLIINDNTDFNSNKDKTINHIVKEVVPQINKSSMLEPKIMNYANDICKHFIDEIANNNSGVFINIIRRFLMYLRREDHHIEPVHELLSLLRKHIGSLIENCENYIVAEDIISQARVLVAQISLQDREKRTLDAYSETVKLQKISSKLMTTMNVDDLLNTIEKDLPSIDIKGAYICLYNNPLMDTQIEEADFYSAFGLYNKKHQKIPANRLYPADFNNSNNNTAYCIHGLTFNEFKYGHIIYEIGSSNGIMYTTITEQLASTLYSINMREENNRVKNKIEHILSVVESKVDVVAENSNSINEGVQEGSTSMEEIAANIKEISRNLMDVTAKIESSVKQINDTNTEVGRLIEESNKIESIVAIISDIAERTKLLSFNASIEAARAGNAGKGFSIVSKEVKNLAYSTITSAENIKVNIDNVQDVTKQTSEAVLSLKTIINQIADSSVIIEHAISEQSAATSELSSLFINAASGTEQISQALKEIKEITHLHD